MKKHTFGSFDEYKQAQRELSLRKAGRRHVRVFTVPAVVDAIKARYQSQLPDTPGVLPVSFGICHGVRKGAEVAMFREALGGRWIGTEITEELCDGVTVLCRDFSLPDAEWLGGTDAIYSNSLDHALEPEQTVLAWLRCLRPRTGRLYIEWNPWSNKLGRKSKADCFAADDAEYSAMLNRLGVVLTVLTVPSGQGWDYKIFEMCCKEEYA